MNFPLLRILACGTAVVLVSSCTSMNKAWDSTSGFVVGIFKRDEPAEQPHKEGAGSVGRNQAGSVQSTQKPFRSTEKPAAQTTASSSSPTQPAWMKKAQEQVKAKSAAAAPSPAPKPPATRELPPVERRTAAATPTPKPSPTPLKNFAAATPTPKASLTPPKKFVAATPTPKASPTPPKKSVADVTPKPTPAVETASEPPADEVAAAIPVPGKPGMVKSPYNPSAGIIDVTGLPSGSEARDPYTNRIFKVP